MTAPYVICFNNGCMADYEVTRALIDTMKKGQGLVVQGINGGWPGDKPGAAAQRLRQGL